LLWLKEKEIIMSLYLDNMEILKGLFPDLWERMPAIETGIDKNLIKAATGKKGLTTLQAGEKFFHDQDNPLKEAENLIQHLHNVKNHSDILFYGLGMGYQIRAFAEQYPDTPFSIYEPVPEIIYQFLCHADLKQLPLNLLKNIYIESKPEEMNPLLTGIVRRVRNSILIIDLPAYKSIFPDKHQAFFSLFQKRLEERCSYLGANHAFQKRWTINSTKNFIYILNTPDILIEKKDSFKNMPAILVASGPSLEEEIDNLRRIREEGLAYIFSVGTAINALVLQGVYPHAACTYDPTEENQVLCREVLKRGISSIPLIFGSTVGYESLAKYPGPKLHMLINQDTPAAFYLKPVNSDNLEFINDAPTIAIITLQLLYKLGFNPVILVGQNLAYLNRKDYTPGSTHPSLEASQQTLDQAVPVKDVYGNQVGSNRNYIQMRKQLEQYLSCVQDLQVINTTKGGAHIEGTRFQTLEEVIRDYLHGRVVIDSWLKVGQCRYDLEYLMEQRATMNDAFEKVNWLLERCKLDLDNIKQLANCSDNVKIGRSYDQFNLSFEELKNNQFMATFIIPMNRVEMELLMLAVPDMSRERDPVAKAEMMEKEFRSCLLSFERDIKSITPIFQEMNRSIEHFCTIQTIREKAAKIKILLVDCDGVLTDGSVYCSSSGDELKRFNYQDRTGIIKLQEKGMQILLINLETNPVIEAAAQKLGIKTVSVRDKRVLLTTVMEEYSVELSEIACLFNDLTDPGLFRQVSLSFTVKDAAEILRHEADYILDVNGGEGVIREIAALLTAEKKII